MTGLVGWLAPEGSEFPSLVRFFLRNPRVGIWQAGRRGKFNRSGRALVVSQEGRTGGLLPKASSVCPKETKCDGGCRYKWSSRMRVYFEVGQVQASRDQGGVLAGDSKSDGGMRGSIVRGQVEMCCRTDSTCSALHSKVPGSREGSLPVLCTQFTMRFCRKGTPYCYNTWSSSSAVRPGQNKAN